uniref:nicotinate-nucleotide--dimethylbenzimidazole phosphoribosyltransferase n=1 Tax=uncultured Desulfovibrio sp. TaxID=167968 RepID=UPI002600EDDF
GQVAMFDNPRDAFGIALKYLGYSQNTENADELRQAAELIRQGIARNRPDPSDPLEVLAKVGGTELAAMAGLMLGGASLRIPVVVDGFIAGAAAAIAVGLHPDAREMLVGSHASVEPGHRLLMRHLGIPTYTNFGLRLGEGTGAALLFPIIDASVRILTEMRTLAELDIRR